MVLSIILSALFLFSLLSIFQTNKIKNIAVNERKFLYMKKLHQGIVSFI